VQHADECSQHLIHEDVELGKGSRKAGGSRWPDEFPDVAARDLYHWPDYVIQRRADL